MKTRKCNSCQNGTTVKHGWILLLEKEPLTYMGDESTLYNMEMKKTSLWKKYDFVDIIRI